MLVDNDRIGDELGRVGQARIATTAAAAAVCQHRGGTGARVGRPGHERDLFCSKNSFKCNKFRVLFFKVLFI